MQTVVRTINGLIILVVIISLSSLGCNRSGHSEPSPQPELTEQTQSLSHSVEHVELVELAELVESLSPRHLQNWEQYIESYSGGLQSAEAELKVRFWHDVVQSDQLDTPLDKLVGIEGGPL